MVEKIVKMNETKYLVAAHKALHEVEPGIEEAVLNLTPKDNASIS